MQVCDWTGIRNVRSNETQLDFLAVGDVSFWQVQVMTFWLVFCTDLKNQWKALHI